MNIIKGLDRILFLIALVAIVPSFITGKDISNDSFKTVTPEHVEWQKEYDERWDYLRRKIEDETGKNLGSGRIEGKTSWSELLKLDDHQELQNIKAKEPIKFKYPPLWLNIAGGFAGSAVGFFIVLFGLKGFTRGIRRLSLWIVDGFRDKKD